MKKEIKHNIESYRSDLIYIASIEKLACEKCPLVPLKRPTGDKDKDDEDFAITIRSISENQGFIKGYEYAISTVKEMLNNSINDNEINILTEVFNKLIDCSVGKV